MWLVAVLLIGFTVRFLQFHFMFISHTNQLVATDFINTNEHNKINWNEKKMCSTFGDQTVNEQLLVRACVVYYYVKHANTAYDMQTTFKSNNKKLSNLIGQKPFHFFWLKINKSISKFRTYFTWFQHSKREKQISNKFPKKPSENGQFTVWCVDICVVRV